MLAHIPPNKGEEIIQEVSTKTATAWVCLGSARGQSPVCVPEVTCAGGCLFFLVLKHWGPTNLLLSPQAGE